jgi:TrpR family transcriptional regulator, trp operon repressor
MQRLIQYFINIQDDRVMRRKLSALLTPNEISEMQHRLEIFVLLKKGVPQREIAKQLGVGIATVTRGSRALKELEESHE